MGDSLILTDPCAGNVAWAIANVTRCHFNGLLGNSRGRPQPLHDLAACERLGIWNLENLDFTQLLEDKVYEFLFVWSPLKIKGGTGSPGNPIAIY